MTDKAMPERIWAYKDDGFTDFISMKGWKENGIVSDFEGAEYIRADLVSAPSNADEPLRAGQYRWAMKNGIGWFVVVIHKRHGDFFWYPSGNNYTIYAVDELSEIGPAIRPPANTAN